MASSKRNAPLDGKSRHASLTAEDDEFVYAVCERFFQCMKETHEAGASNSKRRPGPAASVVDWLVRERGRDDVTREKIYPLIWQAFKRGFLLLKAPIELNLRDRLTEKYKLDAYLAPAAPANGADAASEQAVANADAERKLVVVNVSGPTASRHVGSVAADEIIKLIYRVAAEKKARAVAEGRDPNETRVHLGFGAGYAAMEVARRLADRADAQTPKLTLHAISPGGFYIAKQQMDPTVYFNYFIDAGLDVECVGLFSTPVVATEDFDRLKRNPSLRRCFERRDEIDIIATSLASADDEHGLFRQYFEHLRDGGLVASDALQTLEAQGWVGDVLFQPFSPSGALTPKSHRAVALFTFDELAAFSRRPGKHVVVIGGPCGACGAPKTNALRPLLENERTRLWTRLIVDRDAAKALLGDDATPND
ncbi:MAG: hypothetical protein IJE77_08925 [Thermoguttaceae bacterium]|nr:hypothetical protein [Thermoguttaceae bacterium]MBQ9800437.1 hypothetical protein [Thermoguttaceae bacterium]